MLHEYQIGKYRAYILLWGIGGVVFKNKKKCKKTMIYIRMTASERSYYEIKIIDRRRYLRDLWRKQRNRI